MKATSGSFASRTPRSLKTKRISNAFPLGNQFDFGSRLSVYSIHPQEIMDFVFVLVIIALFFFHRLKAGELKRALVESQQRERNAIAERSKTKSERTAFMDANGICNQLLFNRLLEVENLLGKLQKKPLLYLYIRLHRESDKSGVAGTISTRWQHSFMFYEDSALRVAIPSRSHTAVNRFDFNKLREELQTSLFNENNIACSVGVGSTLGSAFDAYFSRDSNYSLEDTVFLDGDRTA